MCFGPSKSEKKAMQDSAQAQQDLADAQRAAADAAAEAEASARAKRKQGDIADAIDASSGREGMGGSSGRRSLISSAGGGQGFLGRFS